MSSSIGASISFHLTDKPFVMCHDYGTNRTPILAVQDEHASFTLYARDSVPPAEQLRFAQDLLTAVAAYVTAVEMYTAAELTPSSPERR
ncbi:hypothetical protein J7E87_25085 [Streptomyces sp. ISL-1]|uniref:hypothetical protein n=1 Tax=Streptomyces sp. ISL-1 TaxID=2817657 RepID=UPI001BE74A0B|nr:hypothetical protein [Streptomyces sp. ISL-1]MBT2392616.1 hypothetical protein [Streptomyces sp. ISL-1]